jgi:hypothetical protein
VPKAHQLGAVPSIVVLRTCELNTHAESRPPIMLKRSYHFPTIRGMS